MFTPLGYILKDFPGQEKTVYLMVTLPGITAMIGGFASAGLIQRISSKSLVVGSIIMTIVGGLLIRFTGIRSLPLCIAGSALTGFASGVIPSANLAALAETAPADLRDKVCGWTCVCSNLGFIVCNTIAGYSAAGGNWAKSFNAAFVLVPVLLAAVIWYPSGKGSMSKAEAYGETAEGTALPKEERMPKCIMGLIAVKFLSAMFYMSLGLNASSYIINELGTGTSALVGNVTTVNKVVGLVVTMFLFLWLKAFKGASTVAAGIVMGVCTLTVALVPGTIGFVAGYSLLNLGVNAFHAAQGTVVAMTPKGKYVGIASGLFIGATYCGEALCAYVAPWTGKLLFGSDLPSSAIKAGGIFCILFGLISYPFFREAYKRAFPGR
ncbi:hypothetical protein K420107F6_00320 [Lactonifactor longoviformis]|uniref:Predicted arabinose efflux permease, MFS family n=1 Tax=Lactonifactor longoviformis DSM 17459 TaxID=1122155 RepID=A0A1M5A321_9CLOT|nr:Predicted arabinose efflux permease, MFS family [Lactonifactor longoviformis DSM 17459]